MPEAQSAELPEPGRMREQQDLQDRPERTRQGRLTLLAGGADPAAARDALLHTMACKASIKGGRASDPGELRVLMDKVQSGEVQYCPHGRPVKVRLSKYEIEKMFKRA